MKKLGKSRKYFKKIVKKLSIHRRNFWRMFEKILIILGRITISHGKKFLLLRHLSEVFNQINFDKIKRNVRCLVA